MYDKSYKIIDTLKSQATHVIYIYVRVRTLNRIQVDDKNPRKPYGCHRDY